MADYRIVCKNLTSDGTRITRVGLISSTGDPNKANFAKTPKEVNQMIEAGNRCFFTLASGKNAEVDQLGDGFIRTKADGTLKNNLRHLRDCRGFS